MLSELEQEVVDSHKEGYFGAYIQGSWFEYSELQEQIVSGEYPESSRLQEANKKMSGWKKGFDITYLHSLPRAEINPLQVEQEAWKLLSPNIKQYLNEFGTYLEGYSPQNADREQLLVHVNWGWNLLQQWNTISNSYKAKYDKNWSSIPEREEATRQLIQELSSKKP